MQVLVDPDRCEGNAICCALAPDIFDLDADDIAVVLTDRVDDDARRAAAQRAADACPRVAISFLD